MTKSFLLLAAIFILVGGAIGGAFVGGMILGQNRAESQTPATAQFTMPAGASGQAAAIQQFARDIPLDEDGNPDLAALRQMAQSQGSGLPTPPGRTPTASTDADTSAAGEADLQVAAPEFFGRAIGGLVGSLFGAEGATFGSIDSIDDKVITIAGPDGPVEVAIDEDTLIFSGEGEVEDLQEGMTIAALGVTNEETGQLEAVAIIVLPELFANFPTEGAFPGIGGEFPRRPAGTRP